ncbi:MAG: hypothetical protein ABI175_25705 [Polyangiales bacterium]
MLRTAFLRLFTIAFLATLSLASAIGCASSASGGDTPGEDGGTDTSTASDTSPATDAVGGDTKIDSGCPAPKTACSGVCTDVGTDNANCGKCGNKCPGAATCIAGVCKTTCTGGKISCDGVCVDLLGDPDHCGDCVTKCGKDDGGTAKLCVDAICKLDCTSKTDCGIEKCIDLKTDDRNCGACGTVCPTGFGCAAGVCACTAGTTKCGSLCKDLKTDSFNCGACSKVCGSFSTCTAGACVCSSGYTDCSGTCKSLSTDDLNCGACGVVCDKTAGKRCIGSKCTLDCGTTGTDCGGVCKFLQYDAANCGACGKTCGAGQYCSLGVCKCGTGLTDCSGLCKDLKSDGGNCGFCGRVCGTGTVCSGGGCGATCGGGFTACGTSCLDTANDPKNCGSCGKVCASGICGGGVCLTAPKCSAGPFNVLFYGPTLSGEQPSLPAGSVVTVADEGMWRAMSTSDFAKFHLIVIGEGGVCPASTSYQAAFDTKATWSTAVKGRIVVTEQDPVFHSSFSSPGAGVFLNAALKWAASGPGTGLYVAAECGARSLDFMTGFGAFSSISGGGDTVHITAPSHGTMIGSTDTSLSSWGSSFHGDITTFPADFVIVANDSSTSGNITVARDKLCGP